jgi:small-conductance mechanosensitive channel
MALVQGALEALVLFFLIIVGSIVLARGAYMLIRYYLDIRTRPSSVKVIARFAQYAIIAAGLYVGFVIVLRLDLPAIAASLGIITLVVAFSLQPVLSNAVAGVLIALERPIRIDDWVEVGASGPCLVRDINMTNTYLRSDRGAHVVLPNSAILSSKVVNYSRTCLVQIPITLEVPVEADFGRVAAEIVKVLEANPKVLPIVSEPERSVKDLLRSPETRTWMECDQDEGMYEPKLLITNVTPTSVFIEVRLWIKDIERKDAIRSEIMNTLLRTLKPMEKRLPPSDDRKDDLMLESLQRVTAELKALNERIEEKERASVRR